jgi:hypothetical protein
MFLWQRLITDLPRGGAQSERGSDGGYGGESGYGGGYDGEGTGGGGMSTGDRGFDSYGIGEIGGFDSYGFGGTGSYGVGPSTGLEGALGDTGSRGFSTSTSGYGQESSGRSGGGRSGGSQLGSDLGSTLGDTGSRGMGMESYGGNWGGDTVVGGGIGDLNDALGDRGPMGFGTTTGGWGDTAPFGGAGLSAPALDYDYAGMYSPSMGMGFGLDPTGMYAGAPYGTADLEMQGFLGTGGVPGSRIGPTGQTMTEQQRAQAELEASLNPTTEILGSPTNAQIASMMFGVPEQALSWSYSPTPAPTDQTGKFQNQLSAEQAQRVAQMQVAAADLNPMSQPYDAVAPTTSMMAAAAAGVPAGPQGPAMVEAPAPPDPSQRPAYVEAPTSVAAAPAPFGPVEAPAPAMQNVPAPPDPSQRPAYVEVAAPAAPDPTPSAPASTPGFFGNRTAQTVGDALLSAAVPGAGLVNLGLYGLTGTGLTGQAVNVASGQGINTEGGLMGLLSGREGVPQDVSVGGGGYSPSPEAQAPYETSVASAPAATATAPSAVASAPAGIMNLANFGRAQIPAYQVVPTQSPAFSGTPASRPAPSTSYYNPAGYPVLYSDYLMPRPYRA